MAERIVSPGVFTSEIDQSFLPAAVSNIGAALIGVCQKGPAFTPTIVESYTDFKLKFGGLNPDYYLPYTAKSYLKNAGTATIVRVLGSSGYTSSNVGVLKTLGTGGTAASGAFGLSSAFAAANGTATIGADISFTGSDGNVYKFESWSGSAFATDGPGAFGFSNPEGKTYFFQVGDNVQRTADDLQRQINAGSAGHGIVCNVHSVAAGTSAAISSSAFGTYGAADQNTINATSGSFLILSSSVSSSYMNSLTIHTNGASYFTSSTHVGNSLDSGLTGLWTDASDPHTFAGGLSSTNATTIAALFSTSSVGNLNSTTVNSNNNKIQTLQLDWLGAGTLSPTMSLKSSDSNYISSILGTGPSPQHGYSGTTQDVYPAYVYDIFKSTADDQADDTEITIDVSNNSVYGPYSAATTPYITSQTGSGDFGESLFKFTTLSDGEYSNKEIKVGIANIKGPGNVAGSDYAHFDVVIRRFDDTDKRPEAVENFSACNLDPDSNNYIVRRIGDQYKSFDTTSKKVSVNGDYANKSKYVRVSDIVDKVKNGGATDLYPFGFATYPYPFKTGNGDTAIDMPLRLTQVADGETNTKYYHGIAFDSGSTSLSGYNKDILPYLGPIAAGAAISSSAFQLENCGVTIDSGISTKKFILGFKDGKDGFEPRFFGGPASATPADGEAWGLGKAQASDSGSFTDAIATISNQDEIDINMLVVPGANSVVGNGKIVSRARDTVEDRGDAFYVFDAGDWDSSIADVVSNVQTLDSNYSANYWPWVKIFDDENNKHIWTPPSVVVPGVIAFTDKIAHPWFAPAGLNRGGLTEVVMAKDRLTHSERDTLYEGRVNPIATFPGEGVVIWGQKTLQAKPSALDRVNVRRLLIKVKKFIASTSRYLVFEQNTEATRQRFLNIVNPYLESVQSNSGLTAFRVVVDETINTPDVIDRNELKGQIFIQPTRTAEFIVLDFVVMPTGASFPE